MTGSTYLDLAILVLALISGLLAMYRGFSREVLSIGSWLVAAAAAGWFVIGQKALAEDISTKMNIGNTTLTQIGVGALIFLVTLIIVHLVTSRISDLVLDSRVGMIDRVLGFLFGLARAYLLVLVAYMGVAAMIEKKSDHPEFVRNSQMVKWVEGAGDSLAISLKSFAESFLAKKAADKT